MNKFEQASRLKLRISTDHGAIATEDLWRLPLTSKTKINLDKIAKTLSKEVKEQDEESFVTIKSEANTETELKFEIVKYVIACKLAENAEKLLAKKRERDNDTIDDIIRMKKHSELTEKSVEELEAMKKG